MPEPVNERVRKHRSEHAAYHKAHQRLKREIAKTKRAIEQCNARVGRDEMQWERMPPSNDRDLVRSLIVWNSNQLRILREETLPREQAELARMEAEHRDVIAAARERRIVERRMAYLLS